MIRGRRGRRVRPRIPAALALAAALAACIRTDTIDVTDGSLVNRNAVRIVEPLPLTEEAQEGCDDLDTEILEECPQPPQNNLPHFLDPVGLVDPNTKTPLYDFCSCTENKYDLGALAKVTIYIEDRDAVGDSLDEIYVALLLDPDPNDDRPHEAAAYSSYHNAQEPIPLASNIVYRPIGRDTIQLRELQLGGDDTRFDLCNGASKDPLDPGYHRLDIVATDRPWVTLDNDVVQVGVPDLANAATFDVSTYVFRCSDPSATNCNTQCQALGEDVE